MLIIFVIFTLLISALEAVYRFSLALLFWSLPLGAGFAAAFEVAATHPADPFAPFYAFVAVTLIGRLAFACLTAVLQQAASR